MIIVEAKVIMYKGSIAGTTPLISGFKCSMRFYENEYGYGHTCRLTTKSGESIPLDTETVVEMEVLGGEIIIRNFQENIEFEFALGIQFGKGVISKVKEIYVERDTLEGLDDLNMIRDIVSYAETLPNAIVFEDVYELLS